MGDEVRPIRGTIGEPVPAGGDGFPTREGKRPVPGDVVDRDERPNTKKIRVLRLIAIEGPDHWVRRTLEQGAVSPGHPLIIATDRTIVEVERKVLEQGDRNYGLPAHLLIGE